MSEISDNLQAIRQRIRENAASFGRYDHGSSVQLVMSGGLNETSDIGAEGAPNLWRGSPRLQLGATRSSICLVAVSKTRSADEILVAAHAGQRDFGENYAQEGVGKILLLREKLADIKAPLVWHFIGPLQSNKTRLVAEHFDWVHSLARSKIAERLASQRPRHLPPLQVLVEVNVSGEASKSGSAPEDTLSLCRAVMTLPGLTLRGLMCIPAPANDFAAQRRPFARLYALWEELRKKGLPLDTLSMGMSDDYPAAICEGSNMVRIGTAIFGARA